METALGLAVALAAFGLTYVMCIRPMRRGQCAMQPGRSENDTQTDLETDTEIDAETEAEIARLHAEIDDLRRGAR